MDDLKFDEHGLMPAVVQDRLTGQVRMCAFVNREAIARHAASGRATFFSRSRRRLWEKGETSGNTLLVRELYVDCDADTCSSWPIRPALRATRGSRAAFSAISSAEGARDESGARGARSWSVWKRKSRRRRKSTAEKSYTKSLLEAGAGKIGDKVREEADEFARAIGSKR